MSGASRSVEWKLMVAWVRGPQAGLRGSRQLRGRNATLVILAVEKRGRASGRTRMGYPGFQEGDIGDLIKKHVAPGSTIYTDGLKTFAGLPEAGFRHIARSQPVR